MCHLSTPAERSPTLRDHGGAYRPSRWSPSSQTWISGPPRTASRTRKSPPRPSGCGRISKRSTRRHYEQSTRRRTLIIDLEALRVRLYRQLAEQGRVASSDRIAQELGASPAEAADAFAALHRDRHLALDRDGRIELAHPFGTRDFGFSVKSRTALWWGGCAWDSFAVPHLVPGAAPALIATACPACGTAHAWNVGRERPPSGDQVAHFLVPMAHVWDDVVHACENQRIFCNEDCVERWLTESGNNKGDVFDLTALWNLASDWYTGRLEPGYRRREPAEAAAYFRSVGLTGTFWGN
jgi:hypothetical protein